MPTRPAKPLPNRSSTANKMPKRFRRRPRLSSRPISGTATAITAARRKSRRDSATSSDVAVSPKKTSVSAKPSNATYPVPASQTRPSAMAVRSKASSDHPHSASRAGPVVEVGGEAEAQPVGVARTQDVRVPAGKGVAVERRDRLLDPLPVRFLGLAGPPDPDHLGQEVRATKCEGGVLGRDP